MSSGVAKCPITGQHCPWLRTTGLEEHGTTIPCVAGLGKGIHGERKSKCSCSVVSSSLQPHGLQPAGLLCPWDSLDKKPGIGCHFLLQGNFLIQGLNQSSASSSSPASSALAGRFFTTEPPRNPKLKHSQKPTSLLSEPPRSSNCRRSSGMSKEAAIKWGMVRLVT